MTLRRRITLVSAAAVAVAVLLASALTYLLTSNELHAELDAQLKGRAERLQLAFRERGGHPRRRFSHDHLGGNRASATSEQPQTLSNDPLNSLHTGPGQVRGYQQLVNPQGTILFRTASLKLPVSATVRTLAAHGAGVSFSNARVSGIDMRILAVPLRKGLAVEFAQPLTDVNHLLSRLRLILALVALGGIALAAVLGLLVAGTAVAPVRRLAQAIEHVRSTRDLTRRVRRTGGDEIGRLAIDFNAMLDALQSSMKALDTSVSAQRQLVADASHELRTPVTSLRMNIELLQHSKALGDEEAERTLGAALSQTEELSALIDDLIALADGEERKDSWEDVRLDLVVSEAVERALRNRPASRISIDLQPVVLSGAPERLGRAVGNLIDNALKYSPEGSPVQVSLRGGQLSVRDHGAGVPEADLPHIFDRFYRGLEARGRAGSGLGLAIVRQVAEQHGGGVSVSRPEDGGTLMRLSLPGAEMVEESRDAEQRDLGCAEQGDESGAAQHAALRSPGTAPAQPHTDAGTLSQDAPPGGSRRAEPRPQRGSPSAPRAAAPQR